MDDQGTEMTVFPPGLENSDGGLHTVEALERIRTGVLNVRPTPIKYPFSAYDVTFIIAGFLTLIFGGDIIGGIFVLLCSLSSVLVRRIKINSKDKWLIDVVNEYISAIESLSQSYNLENQENAGRRLEKGSVEVLRDGRVVSLPDAMIVEGDYLKDGNSWRVSEETVAISQVKGMRGCSKVLNSWEKGIQRGRHSIAVVVLFGFVVAALLSGIRDDGLKDTFLLVAVGISGLSELLTFVLEWLAAHIFFSRMGLRGKGSHNPVFYLGSVTVVAFVDKQGVLSETTPAPEHIFTFGKDTKPVIIDCSTDVVAPTIKESGDDNSVSIHMSRDDSEAMDEVRNPGEIRMEGDWKVHISSLTPIGLASHFCGICLDEGKLAPLENQYMNLQGGGQWDCLCFVGKMIGFSKEDIEMQYRVLNVGHIVSLDVSSGDREGKLLSMQEQRKRVMSSTAVLPTSPHDQVIQLFSRGESSLVVEHCDYIWNGSQIVQMGNDHRQRILNLTRRWVNEDMQVYALAYTPIPPHRSGVFSDHLGPYVLHLDHGTVSIPSPGDCNKKDDDDEVDSAESSTDELLNYISRKNESMRRRVREESWEEKQVHENRISCLDIHDEDTIRKLQRGQVFLGLVSSRCPPKVGMFDLVDSLNSSSIRFVLFSSSNKKKSVGLAAKLGLDTDWNFYITLKDPAPRIGSVESVSSTVLSPTSSKHKVANISKLPIGISSIRSHLEEVDNVPLLVSLFTDSTWSSTCEMIKIFQENGETVLCLGSDQKSSNMNVFLQADVSFSVHPLAQPSNCNVEEIVAETDKVRQRDAFEEIAAMLTSYPCVFQLPVTVNLREFTQNAIFESRNIMLASIQAISYCGGIMLMLFTLIFLSISSGSPQIYELYHIVWFFIVILYPLTFSISFSPPVRDVLISRYIAPKNDTPLRSEPRFWLYFMLRFVPSAVLCLYIFNSILATLLNRSFADIVFKAWNSPDLEIQKDALIVAQNYTLWVFVFWSIILSVNFQHRTAGIQHIFQRWNKAWIFTSIFAIILQTCFCVISLRLTDSSYHEFPSVTVTTLVFSWPVGILVVDSLVKHLDDKHFSVFQRRLRAVYQTKLGMWSPK